jgi:hypothetical protein
MRRESSVPAQLVRVSRQRQAGGASRHTLHRWGLADVCSPTTASRGRTLTTGRERPCPTPWLSRWKRLESKRAKRLAGDITTPDVPRPLLDYAEQLERLAVEAEERAFALIGTLDTTQALRADMRRWWGALGDAQLNHDAVARGNVLLRLGHRLVGGASRPETVTVPGERRVLALLKNLQHSLLDQSVDDARHAELPDPAVRLGEFGVLASPQLVRSLGDC